MKPANLWWVYLSILIAAAGVVIHVGAVIAGPSWFEFFNAPPSVQASARDGTWLAPASALVIAALMGICGAYAASAVGMIRRLPLLTVGLAGMSAICLIRAMLLPVLAVTHPELRNTFEVVAALVWGAAGLGFAVAFKTARTPALQTP